MTLDDWINPIYLEKDKIKQLNAEFTTAHSFPHISIDNFFKKEKLEKLKTELEKEQYYLEDSDLYQFLRTVDFKNTTNKTIKELRTFLMSEEFTNLIESIIGSKIARGEMDLHSLKLENTHYLLCHDDKVQHRKIAFIINFSEFEEKDGGELELFDIDKKDIGKVFKKITPKFGKFNMFQVSDNSYHQIAEVTSERPRITIGGWYYE